MSNAASPPHRDLAALQRRAVGYASYAFYVLFAINFLNYLDRFLLTGAANTVAHELNFGIDKVGELSTALTVFIILSAIPFSLWADRAKLKNVIGVSLATGFTGLAGNFITLLLSRMVLGIDEGGYSPPAMPCWPTITAAHSAPKSSATYDSTDVLQGSLTKISGPIDVSGGWFDAGDYLKFVETASYTDAIMLFAARQYPSLVDSGSANFNAEGKYGLDWLQKMWDQNHQILYYQVGIGNGNGSSILGDHDFWRFPQADDQMNAKPGDPGYYVEYRPVFRLGPSGSNISPNLAGRLAAAFALCYQLYHASHTSYANQCLLSAETIFDLAKTTNVGQLTTAAPYDYYPETKWRDDLELGATELYFATALGHLPAGLPHTSPSFYLQKAASWAHAYMTGPNADADSLNLYDVSGLADYELFNAMTQARNPGNLAVTQTDLLNDLKTQLDNGVSQASKDPFGLGIAYGQGDASPHALGYVLEASWYNELAGSSSYRTFGLNQRNWILGENAWGLRLLSGLAARSQTACSIRWQTSLDR